MAQVLKRRRLANPRRRRRNMSAKQIRFFGTKRQRAALKNRRRRRNQGGNGIVSQAEHAAAGAIRSVERAAEDAIDTVTRSVNRRRNVGEILTVLPANPGRRRRRNRRVARTRTRRRNRGRVRVYNRRRTRNRRTYNRRRRTYNVRRHRRRSNPRVVVRYRNRRHHRRHNRRRNQGGMFSLGGDFGKVIGVLGGAVVTSMVMGFLPSSMTGGTMGLVTTGIAAVVLGQVAGKVFKNRSLGTFVTVGGLLLVALPLVSQIFPALNLPFTTSGMGLLTSSNFFVPQVNLPGSMASFVSPAAIPAPVSVPASTLRGLGQGASPLIGLRTARRTGRLR